MEQFKKNWTSQEQGLSLYLFKLSFIHISRALKFSSYMCSTFLNKFTPTHCPFVTITVSIWLFVLLLSGKRRLSELNTISYGNYHYWSVHSPSLVTFFHILCPFSFPTSSEATIPINPKYICVCTCSWKMCIVLYQYILIHLNGIDVIYLISFFTQHQDCIIHSCICFSLRITA